MKQINEVTNETYHTMADRSREAVGDSNSYRMALITRAQATSNLFMDDRGAMATELARILSLPTPLKEQKLVEFLMRGSIS